MGEGTGKQMTPGAYSIRQYDSYANKGESWAIMEGDDNHDRDDMSDTTTSTTTNRSTTYSSDLVDDASSSVSSSCSSSLRSGGSLYDLSDLMAELPVKRGLSMYFQGKSQSFTSLSKVNSIEDLKKKETPYQRSKALKSCKSYGGGLGTQRSAYTLVPKATISKVKKSPRGSLSSACFTSRGGTSVGITSNNVPPLSVTKKV